MKRLILILPVFLATVLTGCGGGGGSGGAAGDAPSTASSDVELGRRELFAATVAVTSGSVLAAGTAADFSIQVANASAAITSIEVLLGSDYESAVTATPVAQGDGMWTVHAVMPDPLPADAGVLVRLHLSDDSVLESSVEDFPIAAR